MTVDGPIIVALAALAGSLVGAFSSVAATFIGQRLQARWTRCASLPRLAGSSGPRLFNRFGRLPPRATSSHAPKNPVR